MNAKESLILYWEKSTIVTDKKVVDAFKKIKRENFILQKDKDQVYNDTALSLICGSTLSQPTTIMVMLQAVELKPNLKVLEIGTGSGYTAALLNELVKPRGKVFTIEIYPDLVDFAKRNLKKENVTDVEVVVGDGKQGLESEAPFDRILVNASTEHIPEILLEQLKVGGILLAPIGPEYGQKLIKFTKEKTKIKEEVLGDFTFIKLQ